MGVDCKLYLPPGVDVHDVALVIGAAAGLPVRAETIGNGSRDPFDAARCDGATAEASGVTPNMVMIRLCGRMIDGEDAHECTFHFSGSDFPFAAVSLLARSTPFWISVFRVVGEHFGGALNEADTDSTLADWWPSQYAPNPSDGPAYHDHQARMLAVKPANLDRQAGAYA